MSTVQKILSPEEIATQSPVQVPHLRLPDPSVSLDSPQTIKVPFGVAWALALVGCVGAKLWGV